MEVVMNNNRFNSKAVAMEMLDSLKEYSSFTTTIKTNCHGFITIYRSNELDQNFCDTLLIVTLDHDRGYFKVEVIDRQYQHADDRKPRLHVKSLKEGYFRFPVVQELRRTLEEQYFDLHHYFASAS